jgi:hypothetical protein
MNTIVRGQRSRTAQILGEYFESKGGVLTQKEYRKEKDTPIRLESVKKVFGNWSRMEKIVAKRGFNIRNDNKPGPDNDSRKLIFAANNEAAQREALLRSVGEDVEQKTAREEAARAQIEADALNAKTPEGARENKVRKGGTESVDAKVLKESLARAVAEEHAMLAKTAEGSALGKELLGGVEDQDLKHATQVRANERTERSALLAATPEGSALAMLEEDDSDGHLTREAEARARNELRPYVDPATDERIGEFVAAEGKKLRPETKEAIARLEDTEIDMSMSAALRGERARDAVGASDILIDEAPENAPPADRAPAEDLVGVSDERMKKVGFAKVETAPEAEKPETDGAKPLASSMGMGGKHAKEVDETVNFEQNKDNPEAPPADRNPDPKFAGTAETESESEEEAPKPEETPKPVATKPAAKTAGAKPAAKK